MEVAQPRAMNTTNPPNGSIRYEGPWLPLVTLGMWLVIGPRSLVHSSDPEGMEGRFLSASESLRLCFWDSSKEVMESVIRTWILFRAECEWPGGPKWVLRTAEWDRGGDRQRWKSLHNTLDRLAITATHLLVTDEFVTKFLSDMRRLCWPLVQDKLGVKTRTVEVTNTDTRLDVKIGHLGNSLVVASTVFPQDVGLFSQIQKLHRELNEYERSVGRVDGYHETFDWSDLAGSCTLSVDEIPYAFDCYDWEYYWEWKGRRDREHPTDQHGQ